MNRMFYRVLSLALLGVMTLAAGTDRTGRYCDGSIRVEDLPVLTDKQIADFQELMGGNPVICNIGIYEDGPDKGCWFVWGNFPYARHEGDRRSQSGFIVPPAPLGPDTWLRDFTNALRDEFDTPPGVRFDVLDEVGFVVTVDTEEGEVSVVSFWESPGSMTVLQDALFNTEDFLQAAWTQTSCNTHGIAQCSGPGIVFCKAWVYWNGSAFECGYRCGYPGNPCPNPTQTTRTPSSNSSSLT
jgi:hypothetical protein